MSFAARARPLWLWLILLLGCDGGPSGPSAGSLLVTILGLPNGSAAAVSVSGPGGFSQPVTATQTLTDLPPGIYTVAATSVTAGTSEYSPSPTNQTIAVSSAQASASVYYSPATGSLTVTINGLGTSKTAAVTVTGPGGYNQSVTATQTLSGLDPGDYIITAQNVTASCGATAYTASPVSQSATVAVSITAGVSVTYSPPSGGIPNLCIDGLYLTQSTQNYAGTVPLVGNRQGYLRVFVIADRTNSAAPEVRVRFYNGLVALDSALILAPALSVPTAVNESSLSYSWNVPVAGTLIQPGLSIQAEVDPSNLVTESIETDNLFPATGQLAMDVRTVPTLNVTFVPILQSSTGQQGNVTTTNKDSFLDMTKRMHPIDAVNAVVRSPMTTSTLLQVDGTGWQTVLSELDARRVADSTLSAYSGLYYGVAKVSYTSGVAGIAYVSSQSVSARAAMGWDFQPSGAIVVAHELGHNWGRNHAPCGGPLGIDPQYPQSDGSIGSYGLDVTTQTLKPPTLSDVMGYCDPKWISDYNYQGVLNYRATQPLVMSAATAPMVQPCLLLWGHISNGELVLEPAFYIATRPRLPSQRGPYSIEARAADGTTLFALSFAPSEVADIPGSQQNYAFAVPLSAAKAARLSSLHLSGRGREAVLGAGIPPTSAPAAQGQAGLSADSVELRRAGGDRLRLRWNSSARPMVMVRDPDTGEVLSFARGGDIELSSSKNEVELIMSDGITSRAKRVRAAQ